jgi:hypothetical protein
VNLGNPLRRKVPTYMQNVCQYLPALANWLSSMGQVFTLGGCQPFLFKWIRLLAMYSDQGCAVDLLNQTASCD